MESKTWYRRLVAACATIALGVGLAACGNDDGNIGANSAGEILVTPNPVTFSGTRSGDTSTESFQVRNVGQGTLEVFEMRLTSESGNPSNFELQDGPSGEFSVPAGESRSFTVAFSPNASEDGASEARLEFLSNDTEYSEGEPYEVPVVAFGNQPRLQVTPSPVKFPQISTDQTFTRTVQVTNTGVSDLEIYERPEIAGSEAFEIQKLDTSFPTQLASVGSDGDATTEMSFEIEYAPTSNSSDTADLVFKTNEKQGATAQNPATSRVGVEATANTPCLLVKDGRVRDVGSVAIGNSTSSTITVQSCGAKPVLISDVELAKNSEADEFSLDFGDLDGNDDGAIDEPIELTSRGASEQFVLDYQPTGEGVDNATIVLETNDPVKPEVAIEVTGRGATGACPTADLTAKVRGKSAVPKERLAAAPLDYIILDGSDSSDPDGEVVSYQWEVKEKPSKDVPVQLKAPSDADGGDPAKNPERIFQVLTAGEYEIALQVEDDDKLVSCNTATVTINAIPNERIHAELTWTNPRDEDESDDRGSDVDLHMVKMGADFGKWFEAPYDIYFRNQGSTNDSGIWNPESPSLDRDDTNGAGPENIQMDDPAECQWYAIGVHYYKQEFGTAYATLRIYINEELVYEKLNQPLEQSGDFWDVARIHWPTGRVIDRDRLLESTPRGEQPAVTEAMKASGLCTAEDLYSVSQ